MTSTGSDHGFEMTDLDWKRIAAAGGLPEDDQQLRACLKANIDHFIQTVREFHNGASTRAIKPALSRVEKLSADLLRAIDSHPQVRARLAGVALLWLQRYDNRDEIALGRGRAAVDRAAELISFINEMARMNLDVNQGGGDEVWFPGHQSSNPPVRTFISVLLNIWRFRLGREVTNWGTDASAAHLTKFVHECLSVAGQASPSIEATRNRIKHVKADMDNNEADGHGWILFVPTTSRDT